MPLEHSRGIVRWGHPDGCFLNAQGQKVAHSYSPTHQLGSATYTHGVKYPVERQTGSKACHILMALAFEGPRPVFTDRNGKSYVGICHHLIPDKLDYRPANLLCWLTREQHAEADRRQRALRQLLPDMHALPYDEHRRLQDPRSMSREQFEIILQSLKDYYGTEKHL